MPIEQPGKRIEKKEGSNIAETHLFPLVNERLQARYDRIAPAWNSDAYEGTRRDDLIPELVRLLEAGSASLKILEAMSGTALLAQELKRQNPGHNFYALDFSQGMLNQIPHGIEKVQASVIAMPFPDGSFDRVAIRNALYDLPRRLQRKALNEISRVLAPDGIFVLQHYHTTPETFEYLNELVKRKDVASSQNEDMGEERFPRYFAPVEEFESWLTEEGFDFSREGTFEGAIRYMRTAEMSDMDFWASYANSLPDDVKESLKMRTEGDGTLTFNFPGVIYKIKKRA